MWQSIHIHLKKALVPVLLGGLFGALPAMATQVSIVTNLGDIVVELDEQKAPETAANFLEYVDSDAYDNTIFHRVIQGFVVQGGGHYADMSEAEEGDAINNEAANGLLNVRGTISMAREDEIDSARRQFFINVVDNERLNHNPEKSCTREDQAAAAAALERGLHRPLTCKNYGYAVFGKVISGMDVVDLIELSDTGSVGGHDDVPITPILILSVERVPEDS